MAAVATRHMQVYGKAQTAWHVPATITGAEALTNFRSIELKEAGAGGIARPNVGALGGEAASVQGARYWEISASTELTYPNTPGSLASWQHACLWGGCSVVEVAGIVDVEPTTNQTAVVPMTLVRTYRDGERVTATDAVLAPVKIYGQGGGVVMVDWAGVGTFVEPTLETTLAIAPSPAVAGSAPIGCIGITYGDSISTGDVYSWSLTTGVTVHAREDQTQPYGYGTPVVAHDGAGELTATVVWAAGYHAVQTAGADVSVEIDAAGGRVAIVAHGRVVSVTPVDVAGALGAEVVIRLETTSSMPWSMELG